VTPASRLSGGGAARTCRAGEAGQFLLELVIAASIACVLGGAAAPHLAAQRDAATAAAAARHVGALMHDLRARSLRHGTTTALVFRTDGLSIAFAAFVDGNRNGVLSADIVRGADRQVTPWGSLGDDFPRASFGIIPGATDPDSGAPLVGTPLKIGGSGILSFGPDGTSTSGTLYIRGPGAQQFALRALGATGRTRVLRFDPVPGTWTSP